MTFSSPIWPVLIVGGMWEWLYCQNVCLSMTDVCLLGIAGLYTIENFPNIGSLERKNVKFTRVLSLSLRPAISACWEVYPWLKNASLLFLIITLGHYFPFRKRRNKITIPLFNFFHNNNFLFCYQFHSGVFPLFPISFPYFPFRLH